MISNRGFVTVATGKVFYRLAKNLVMSYRAFSNCKYPFCVITDFKGKKSLSKYFDQVIILENPNHTYLDKMSVYRLSPYEETIFIDADCSIVNDISFLFDEFYNLGSPISCLGSIRNITDKVRPSHFGQQAIKHFHLKEFIAFNGGVYYYKKCETANGFMQLIFEDLIPNYDKYELTFFAGKKADEPLIGVAMLYFGFKPLDIQTDVMKLIMDLSTLKWDMANKKCYAKVYQKYDVSPLIIHYGSTYNCSTFKYYYYNAKVVCEYKRFLKPISILIIIKETVHWIIDMFSHDNFYRKDKLEWFKGHFSKDYIKNKIIRR